jgi:hypothetical protein
VAGPRHEAKGVKGECAGEWKGCEGKGGDGWLLLTEGAVGVEGRGSG